MNVKNINPNDLAVTTQYPDRKTEIVEILSSIEAAAAAEYLRQTDKANRKALLDLMDEDVRAEIKLLSSFDEDEIGSRMTTNFISVKAGSGIKEAMTALITVEYCGCGYPYNFEKM